MLDERINCCSILADGLGIKTTGFAVDEILLGSCCECDPAGDQRRTGVLGGSGSAEAIVFVERQPLLALPLRL